MGVCGGCVWVCAVAQYAWYMQSAVGNRHTLYPVGRTGARVALWGTQRGRRSAG